MRETSATYAVGHVGEPLVEQTPGKAEQTYLAKMLRGMNRHQRRAFISKFTKAVRAEKKKARVPGA